MGSSFPPRHFPCTFAGMKAVLYILSLLAAVVLGVVAGLVIASIIVASAFFALINAAFHITPRTPDGD